MLHYISNLESVWGPFRLFNYLSFRCVLAAVTAFLIAFAFAPRVIRFFRAKKAFQIQRNAEIMGKTAELHSWKEGTPCMGGLIIFAGVMVSALLWCKINTMVVAALSVYAILTATGFADDYLKLLKGNSNGIKGKTKIFWQITASATAGAILFTNPAYAQSMQELWLPFVKTCVWVMPIIVAIAFLALVISSSSNALNLTDGLDGLATGCTISVVLAYGIFAYVTGNQIAAEYLSLGYIPDCGTRRLVLHYFGRGNGIFMVQLLSRLHLDGRHRLARTWRNYRRNRIYGSPANNFDFGWRSFRDGNNVGNNSNEVLQADRRQEDFQKIANPPPF